MEKLSPFFLISGRHAPSPETLTLALPSKPLSQQTYAENLVSRLSDAQKKFDSIQADLRRSQGEHYDQNARNLQVHDGIRVYVHRPPPSTQPQGLSPRFTHRFDGPFIVQGLVHGRQDLIKLHHEITGQDILVVNIDKIVVAPTGDPQDLRPESEPPLQPVPIQPAPSQSISPDVAKVAFAFGQVLRSLPRHQAFVSEACKTVYQTMPEAWDILSRCGKLKGLVSKCSYLSMKGGAQGGTYMYVIVLDGKHFDELNK